MLGDGAAFFESKAACAASPRAAAALEDNTQLSRAALRPETAAVVQIPASLDAIYLETRGAPGDIVVLNLKRTNARRKERR